MELVTVAGNLSVVAVELVTVAGKLTMVAVKLVTAVADVLMVVTNVLMVWNLTLFAHRKIFISKKFSIFAYIITGIGSIVFRVSGDSILINDKIMASAMKNKWITMLGILAVMMTGKAQTAGKVVPIKYGNMDHWVVRNIKESEIIGGKTREVFAVGPSMVINENKPYVNLGGSPWGTSNVMARVSGITKTNNSVYRDKRGSGYCAKLVTHIEKVKVLGLINIKVLAAGSLFLGDVREPITGTKDGPKSINWGVPFTLRPKAVRYDYRTLLSDSPTRIRQTGFSSASKVDGHDYAVTTFYLQKRFEDSKGNITAKRVGTMVVKYGKSTNGWVNKATYTIHYGDIRNMAGYDAGLMGLRSTDYARNSKGQSVPVKETGWAEATETPTHMILQFSSSHGGAYVGTPGNTLWIDNVELVY